MNIFAWLGLPNLDKLFSGTALITNEADSVAAATIMPFAIGAILAFAIYIPSLLPGSEGRHLRQLLAPRDPEKEEAPKSD